MCKEECCKNKLPQKVKVLCVEEKTDLVSPGYPEITLIRHGSKGKLPDHDGWYLVYNGLLRMLEFRDGDWVNWGYISIFDDTYHKHDNPDWFEMVIIKK